jgi:hypothetical protein
LSWAILACTALMAALSASIVAPMLGAYSTASTCPLCTASFGSTLITLMTPEFWKLSARIPLLVTLPVSAFRLVLATRGTYQTTAAAQTAAISRPPSTCVTLHLRPIRYGR